MEFIKLNIGWDADPNDPMPKVEIDKPSYRLILTFSLNTLIHKDVDDDDIGVLEFSNCYKYRLGVTNDEGFYRGQCRFSNSGIKWGNYYKMIGTNWNNDFPKDEIVVNNELREDKELCHYLFYFRDNTFECLAKSQSFTVKRIGNFNSL